MRVFSIVHVIGLLVLSSDAIGIPMHLWSKHFGNYSIDLAEEIAADPTGGFGITGSVITAVDFGGGLLYPISGGSMFIAKYDDDCVHEWSKLFDEASVTDVAIDYQGNVIMVGQCHGTVDFGGGPLPGLAGTFLVKLDTNGTHVWSRRYPVGVNGVTVDGLGNIYVAGSFGSTYSFGGPPLSSAGSADVFIVKYDLVGVHVWSKRYGGTSGEIGTYIALDDFGNIVVSGTCNGTVDFGGGPLAGPVGVFLLKVDANGTHQWSQRFGGPNNDEVEGLAIDPAGNVFIAGWFSGTASYGGASLVSVGNDTYLAKFAANGTHQWSQRFGGPGDVDRAFALTVDMNGSATIAGEYKAGAQFGGGVLPNAGFEDLFIAMYDAAGAHLWSAGFGSASEYGERGTSLALDANGNVVLLGYYANTVDFGGGPLQSYGFLDILVAKFGELPVPVLISRFAAMAHGNSVRLTWDVSTDESLRGFTLFRRDDATSASRVIATGDPVATSEFTDASVVPGHSYEYELAVETEDGEVFRSPIAAVNVAMLANALEQNHPNPFNPSTTITYTLSERASTAVRIYDAAGALVVRLDAGEHDVGTHAVTWNGRDAAGRSVASGVYFYQLEGVTGMGARKMVLLK